METKLAGASNLVVMAQDTKEVVAIIKGKKGRNSIVKQLEKAIKQHFVADDVNLTDSRTVDNQNAEFFTAHIYNDGIDWYEDFKIEVIATY
jgi:hypothetical protein